MGTVTTDRIIPSRWTIENHGAPGIWGLMSRERQQSISIDVVFTPRGESHHAAGSESVELVHAGDSVSYDLADVATIVVYAGTNINPGSYPLHALVNFTVLPITLTAAMFIAGGSGDNAAPGAPSSTGPLPVTVINTTTREIPVVRGAQLRYNLAATAPPGTSFTVPATTTRSVPFNFTDLDTEGYVNVAPFVFPGPFTIPAGQGIRIPAGSPWTFMRASIQGFLDNTQPPNAHPGLGYNVQVALLMTPSVNNINGVASAWDDVARTQDITFSQLTLGASGMLVPLNFPGATDIIAVVANNGLVPLNMGLTWITVELLTTP